MIDLVIDARLGGALPEGQRSHKGERQERETRDFHNKLRFIKG